MTTLPVESPSPSTPSTPPFAPSAPRTSAPRDPDDGRLVVSEEGWGEASATAAFVHVVLTSNEFFSGHAALEKARELRHLCLALEARGVAENCVALEGASLDVSTGLFTKSSSVTYRLRIHLTDLDLLGSVLDAVAQAKSATLSHIVWDYRGAVDEEHAVLAQCVARARSKARVLADALDVSLDALHAVREERTDDAPRAQSPILFGVPPASRARASMPTIGGALAGLELAPKKQVRVRVVLEYRVRAAAAGAPTRQFLDATRAVR